MKHLIPKALRSLAFALCAVAASPGAQAAGSAADLAPTPQMGFNNWNSTHCRTEFNEAMIRGIADKFIELGLKDAGYTYVNIDDCWAESERDADGNLVVDAKRFPHGLKALADYIHSKGLKFGVYTSAGAHTCATTEEGGFPGALHHEKQDAALFASFGVDYLKYDNCNNENIDARIRYRAMGEALRATGRPIFYSLCEWGENKPWLWGGEPVGAQSWRTTGDISDNYKSMLENYERNVELAGNGGHGRWNDPDMLEVGNGGMSDAEYRSHFSLWAIMAAPLLIGTDLRTIKPEALKILLNKEVIAVDQDALGEQGWRVRHDAATGVDVIVKPLGDGSRAVVVFNSGEAVRDVAVAAKDLRLKPGSYVVRDLWRHGETRGDGAIKIKLAPHASAMYRISAA
ncbi:MAG: glycoside hydrolase family 27 protein [Rudaea sp.]|uniref:glycoside hydrolase family 27 protein n=1 Tax=Rudaea sp. TaxID=2136325 RepID=UPI0039E5DA72